MPSSRRRGRRGRRRRQRRLHARRGCCGKATRQAAAKARPERAARALSHRSRHGRSPTRRGGAWIDFQNDVTREGHRARGARGLHFGRAPEALHDARHGDRPGQDLQRQRPCGDGGADRPHDRRSRHDHLSSALHSRADGRHCRAPARRADQSAEAPAARSRASRRWRAIARVWRLAEAGVVRRRRPRSCDPARGAGARGRRSRCSTVRRSARSR